MCRVGETLTSRFKTYLVTQELPTFAKSKGKMIFRIQYVKIQKIVREQMHTTQ